MKKDHFVIILLPLPPLREFELKYFISISLKTIFYKLFSSYNKLMQKLYVVFFSILIYLNLYYELLDNWSHTVLKKTIVLRYVSLPLRRYWKSICYVKGMYNSMRGFLFFKKNREQEFESSTNNFSIFIIFITKNSKFKIQNYTCVHFSSMSSREKHMPWHNFTLRHVFSPFRTVFLSVV